MNPQPLIATHDVNSTSEWYQAVFGFESGHGGKDYERLLYKGRLVMQLHHWDVHDHPNIGDPDIESRGMECYCGFRQMILTMFYLE